MEVLKGIMFYVFGILGIVAAFAILGLSVGVGARVLHWVLNF